MVALLRSRRYIVPTSCNQGVVYGYRDRRPHREAGAAARPPLPGLARPRRRGGVWPLVRGRALWPLRARRPAHREDHPQGLRALSLRDDHRADRAGAALLLALAPRRGGPGR